MYVCTHQRFLKQAPIRITNCIQLQSIHQSVYPIHVDFIDSVNWVVFPPNVIIDAKLGCLWFLQLKLGSIQNLMPDKIRLVEFLLQRTQGKRQLLQLLQHTVLSPRSTDLDLVEGVFDKLNENYQSFLDVEMQNQVSTLLMHRITQYIKLS